MSRISRICKISRIRVLITRCRWGRPRDKRITYNALQILLLILQIVKIVKILLQIVQIVKRTSGAKLAKHALSVSCSFLRVENGKAKRKVEGAKRRSGGYQT